MSVHPSLRIIPATLAISICLLAAAVQAEEVPGVVLAFKDVNVSSPVLQEVIKAVLVNEGDTVKEGQPIVQLKNEKEELAVQEGQRIVENMEFVSKGAQSLYNDKMGSREAALKARTELELAKIRLAAAEESLKEKTIRAPLSGIVVKKFKESGESIDRAEKLINIINIDQVYAQFYVAPKFLPTLKEGQEVTVKLEAPINAKFVGKIDFIAPNIEASSGLLRVKVIIDNPDHLIKSGLKAAAEFGSK